MRSLTSGLPVEADVAEKQICVTDDMLALLKRTLPADGLAIDVEVSYSKKIAAAATSAAFGEAAALVSKVEADELLDVADACAVSAAFFAVVAEKLKDAAEVTEAAASPALFVKIAFQIV